MLDVLPSEVINLVLFHIETAKDIRALVLTNKRLHSLIQDGDGEGWRIFVRSRFPDVPAPALESSSYSWHHLADSLTWQTRAWDRRSPSFHAMLPSPPSPAQGRRGGPRPRQETPFHAVVDAHFDLLTREDLVIWGAGENLVARRRQGRSATAIPEQTVWHRLEGRDLGYRSGVDDIKAVSLVQDVCGTPGQLGALVGRDNGHLALLSAGESNFGEKLASFTAEHEQNQGTINSVHVLQHQNGLVAAAAKTGAFLYSLPNESGAPLEVAPASYLDLSQQGLNPSAISLGNAKWMSEGLLALGLSGCQNALRYVNVTPSGFGEVVTVRNAALEDRFEINYGKSHLCTGSMTPINASSITGGGGSQLLLSAWRDGTVRLQDLRTPSSHDLVYCDNIDPWSEFEALLPFGTSHFAGGGARGAMIKVFDFRWPRQYYHTTALPCSGVTPLPNPMQSFLAPPSDPGSTGKPCDHVSGRLCRWHALSKSLYHRPNGKFFFSKSLPRGHEHAGVWTMARASPVSPSFYMGISGGVVEAGLAVTPQSSPGVGAEESQQQLEVDPNFGYRGPSLVAGGMGAGYTGYGLEASLMETGDGLLNIHNHRSVRLPPMRGTSMGCGGLSERVGWGTPEGMAMKHRLDPRYHTPTDFEHISTGMEQAVAKLEIR